VMPCSVVIGYQRFRGPCCLHLWVVTPCSVVVGYQRFRGPCRLHLQASQPKKLRIFTVVTTSSPNWRFSAVFTSTCHWSLSWGTQIQFTVSYTVCLRYLTILSSFLGVGLPSGLYPSSVVTYQAKDSELNDSF